ncbi:tail fiber assembly protein [Lelliottia nimipressuralis]|uniref:tail fiber assembly protein n=1 Tax=Lelliottia nimipressuralis TaxID=69220 RepID=UPI003556CCB6
MHLVAVTDADYTTFTGQPPKGKMRGSNGKQPAWVDIPLPTVEETRQGMASCKARLLEEAYAAMKPLELPVKHNMATDEEKAQLEAWGTTAYCWVVLTRRMLRILRGRISGPTSVVTIVARSSPDTHRSRWLLGAGLRLIRPPSG